MQIKYINELPEIMFVYVIAYRHASYQNTYVIASNVEFCVNYLIVVFCDAELCFSVETCRDGGYVVNCMARRKGIGQICGLRHKINLSSS
jgi:hypothetical protein